MTKKIDKDKMIAVMTERIAARFRPDKIILFGSQARGDADPDSDVDLLAVMPVYEKRKATTISMMKSLADLPVSKDIVVTTVEELETRSKLASTVLYPALHEGKVVYAR